MVPGRLEVRECSKDFLDFTTVKTVFENAEEQFGLLLEITFARRSIHRSISHISVVHICVTAAHTSRCGRCGGSLGISMIVRHNIEHNWLSRLINISHNLFFRLFIILHLHILMLNSVLRSTYLIALKFLFKLIEPCLIFLIISHSVWHHLKLIINNSYILLLFSIFTALFLLFLLNGNFLGI